jgi:sulfite oxidase
MNGKPLTLAHGGPLRVILPGILGARSVKWLNRITLQLDHSSSFYQQRDYRVLPPEAVDSETAKKYWDRVPPMLDMPVNSIIGLPKSATTVETDDNGYVEVKGYAVPAGIHGPVRKVEVSIDGGKSWVQAELDYGKYGGLETEERRKKVRWAWCLWKVKAKLEKGEGKRIVSRATDCGGNTQPERGVWNLRGVGYNAWGEVKDLVVV